MTKILETKDWSIIYEKAIREDGSLFFPERLTPEFLDKARRTMGSALFANQYLNAIIDEADRYFKAHWLRYYKTIPTPVYSFGFIDPAIGQKDHHDYTGMAVIDVDTEGTWYLKYAQRERLTPTEIVERMFSLQKEFNLNALGVEIVAYQEALLYLVDQEMRKRKVILPIKGIKRTLVSKQSRVLGLVPRFEWGRILINQGMIAFEDEYATFPRGRFDDILDSLASLEELVFYPEKKEKKLEKPHSPHDPNYERWYIQHLAGKSHEVRREQSE
jgi:predicted phage terminase large subunit-like protein